MNNTYQPFSQLQTIFPNEWVLLGNPKIEKTKVLGGIVLYHSADKKEVCYMGRDKTADYEKVTLVFSGNLKSRRKIGIMKKL
jgi:hypothetical protein